MTSTHELKSLSDDELLRRLAELVQRSRRVEAILVAHIAEVDERRLYIREAPSMFAYCTQVLHLSEHEAYARITVARASRRHPSLLAMLSDGRLHLSGIGKLVPHLTDANAADLLARAAHRTKSQIEELIAEVAPKPDVPAAIRKVPVPDGTASKVELGPDRVGVRGDAPLLAPAPTLHASPPESRPELPPPPPQASAVTALAPARYKVQFTARAELRDKLERLQILLGHDLATAIEAAVTEKLERLEAKRFGLTKTPRRTLDETDTSPRSRHLPAAVRRSVRARDGDQCTFLLRNGARCAERRSLEFHHRHPYGRGGNHDPENVCLMCRQHNAFLAELNYGKEHMEQYRRRGDRGFEGVPLAMFAREPIAFPADATTLVRLHRGTAANASNQRNLPILR
jgi:5-methylcytosine-specific restriction endonuclease McrA